MVDFSLLVEGFFAVLLIAVLVYAIRLNRHISALQKNRTELEALIQTFISSTDRAEAAIARMKQASSENQTVLDDQIKQASQLKRDLEDVIAVANGLKSDPGFMRAAQGAQREATPRRETRPAQDDHKDRLRNQLNALRAKNEAAPQMSSPEASSGQRYASITEDDMRDSLLRQARDEARSIAGSPQSAQTPGALPAADTSQSDEGERDQGGNSLRNKSKADLLKALQGIR